MIRGCLAAFACVLPGVFVAACTTPMFPDELRRKVDTTLSFNDLTKHPDSYKDRTVELGGQILRSLSEEGEVSMLVRALPMQDGNMIIAIGPVIGALSTGNLTDLPVLRLTVNAECFYVWRTQGDQIDEFPWVGHTRYWPLIEQTYCADRENLILPVS